MRNKNTFCLKVATIVFKLIWTFLEHTVHMAAFFFIKDQQCFLVIFFFQLDSKGLGSNENVFSWRKERQCLHVGAFIKSSTYTNEAHKISFFSLSLYFNNKSIGHLWMWPSLIKWCVNATAKNVWLITPVVAPHAP